MNFITDETRLRSDFEKVLTVLKKTKRIDPMSCVQEWTSACLSSCSQIGRAHV